MNVFAVRETNEGSLMRGKRGSSIQTNKPENNRWLRSKRRDKGTLVHLPVGKFGCDLNSSVGKASNC